MQSTATPCEFTIPPLPPYRTLECYTVEPAQPQETTIPQAIRETLRSVRRSPALQRDCWWCAALMVTIIAVGLNETAFLRGLIAASNIVSHPMGLR